MTLPSIHPLVKQALRSDPAVRRITQDRVFAGKYPPEVVLPAVRFRFQWADPLARPTTQWWSFTGEVVCHADSEEVADDLAGAVLGALLQLEGTSHSQGVVQGALDWGVQSVEDGEWTPPKPGRIVAVTLTARPA